jgi:hypothetical protein
MEGIKLLYLFHMPILFTLLINISILVIIIIFFTKSEIKNREARATICNIILGIGHSLVEGLLYQTSWG